MYWNYNSKLQRWLSQKRPISVMFFVWTLYFMLTATSDIRCSSMSSTVMKSQSRISYGSLFASNYLIPIHPLPRERKLKRSHVAAKLANHLSGNLTFGVGSRAHNWLQSTQKCLEVSTWVCNWPQTLTGYLGIMVISRHQWCIWCEFADQTIFRKYSALSFRGYLCHVTCVQ